MTMRTIEIYQGQGRTSSQAVNWPDSSLDEQQAMEALGFKLARYAMVFRPPVPGESNKSFQIYSRDDSIKPIPPATVAAPWADPFRYALFMYVNNTPQGDPVFIATIGGVEAYTRSQLDPAWTTSMEWPNAGILFGFLPLRELVVVSEPGSAPWFGEIQSLFFGHFTPQGSWQPTGADVWHADVQNTQLANGGVRRAHTPKTDVPTQRVSWEYIQLPGAHNP